MTGSNPLDNRDPCEQGIEEILTPCGADEPVGRGGRRQSPGQSLPLSPAPAPHRRRWGDVLIRLVAGGIVVYLLFLFALRIAAR